MGRCFEALRLGARDSALRGQRRGDTGRIQTLTLKVRRSTGGRAVAKVEERRDSLGRLLSRAV